MSIFAKQVSQLEPSDLAELVSERAVENLRLEFKLEVPGKDETLKKLSSFGNTVGGYLVVGARANSTDGRISDLPGVTAEPGYKQRVVQWCFEAVSPPLTVEVSDPLLVPGESRNVAYVVYVPESDHAPHFLNGRKGVYVRTDEFSQRFEARLATQAELLPLLERRKTIVARRQSLIDRATDRFATLVKTRYSELGKKQGGIGARFSLAIVPRYPARQVWNLPDLLTILARKRLNWRGVGFPQTTQGIISQHESALVVWPGSSFSILEANIWGLLFYATEVERDEVKAFTGIHLNHFLGQLVVFIEHACLIIKEMGLAGPIEISMTLDGIRGVPWLDFDFANTPKKGPASELDDSATILISTTAERLLGNRVLVTADLLTFVFFATNWPEVAQDRQKLREMVNAGYQYNHWKPPDDTNQQAGDGLG